MVCGVISRCSVRNWVRCDVHRRYVCVCSVVSRSKIAYTYRRNMISVCELMSGHITISLHCEVLFRELNNNVVHSAEINTKECPS